MFVAVLVVLSVVVLSWVVRAYRVLFFEAPLTGNVFVRACDRFRRAGDIVGVRALVAAGRPSWLAQAAEAAILEECEPSSADRDLDETTAELFDNGEALLRPIRGLASLSSTLGMLFAILSLNGVGVPDDGLLALQAGLVQSLALERAMSCVTLGGATAVVALLSVGALRRQLRRLHDDLALLTASLEAARGGAERVES